MKKEIFIVHNSDIFRKGLNVILRNYFNIEITQLNDTEELTSFTHITNTHIIVFSEIKDIKELNLIFRLKTNNKVHIISINSSNGSSVQISGVDHTITLKTGTKEIREIISGMINSASNTPVEKAGNGDLTLREKDVLHQVALGHANKEIAKKLFISIHTVISHRKNITEKLGIKSISGLTVYAILNNIIDTDTIDPESLI